jgi:hypothetical protein
LFDKIKKFDELRSGEAEERRRTNVRKVW